MQLLSEEDAAGQRRQLLDGHVCQVCQACARAHEGAVVGFCHALLHIVRVMVLCDAHIPVAALHAQLW